MKKHLLLLLSVLFILSSCNVNLDSNSSDISNDISDESQEVSDDIERYYNKPKFTDEIQYITISPENLLFIYMPLSTSKEYIDENKIGDIITMEISHEIIITGKYLKTINNGFKKGTFSYYKDINSTSSKFFDYFAIDDKTGELVRLTYEKAFNLKNENSIYLSKEEIREIAVKYVSDLTGLTGWENCIKTHINNRSWHHFVFLYKAKNGLVINLILCDVDGFGNIMYLDRNSTEALKNVPVLDVEDQVYFEGVKKYILEEQKTFGDKKIVDLKEISFANNKEGHLIYLKELDKNAIEILFLVKYIFEDGSESKNDDVVKLYLLY